eukprot:TRINITY_DN624_c7_g1_i2.p2 TRINITY_DN624_c7_g1~~TRINITY_DN624_c7_g1_i2.p2  ORF type:complete len:278 (+),score=-56.25 TRINITY_DN624_c7_g1_i2:102-935(+)
MHTQFLLLLQHQFCLQLQIFPNERHTEDQGSQCIILLQCTSNFFCSFIANLIFTQEKQQSCRHTEIQRSQCIILLQCKSNLLCSFSTNIVSSYEQQCLNKKAYRGPAWLVYYLSAMQGQFLLPLHRQLHLTLQTAIIVLTYQGLAQSTYCFSAILLQFVLLLHLQSYLPLQTVTIALNKGIPRYNLVRQQLFCNASQISFAPSSPTLLFSMEMAMAQSIPRCNVMHTQSDFIDSKRQIMLLGILSTQSFLIIKGTNDKIFYFSTLVYEVHNSIDILL